MLPERRSSGEERAQRFYTVFNFLECNSIAET